MPPEDAHLLAHTLVWADLRGVHSHGVMRVPEYVRRLTERGVNPAGQPRVLKDVGAALLVDGGNSMGQIGGTFAMRQAIERAGTTGVAAAALRGSNHCGAMAYYAVLALAEDMIGLAATNALPTMAPWGGLDALLGLNPLAVAIPAAEEPPLVLDISFGAAARGKIVVYHQKGLPIPEGWAFDAEGRPTTEPARALEGLIQPIGGYKGTGLALVIGILASVLSGAGYGTEFGSAAEGARAGQDSQFFLALKVAAFEDAATFKRRVDGIIRQIHASRRAPGAERIYVPGELEHETAARYQREGIPLNAATLAGIVAVATRLGVDPAPLQHGPEGEGQSDG
jgi:LDH2 family malate/lactate/ureidoglycolate dehydrogenase